MAELTAGPIRDFNLMYDTARVTATVTVHHGPFAAEAGAGVGLLVVHCIAGTVALGAERLMARDTALHEGATPVRVDPDGIALVCALTFRRADR